MNQPDRNKQIIQDFIRSVWKEGNLDALTSFWTEDCINHAMPSPENQGLPSIRAYHESFGAAFSGFSDVQMDIVQQISEDDRVVTYITTHVTHSGLFFGLEATGKRVTTSVIRIDRIRDDKIAEHWSVSDFSGLMLQLKS
jgi:predicted ester cyclase